MNTMDTTRARAFQPDQAAALGTSTVTPGWDLATERRMDDGRTLARSLGWFSIGLGALQLLAAERVGEWLGMEDRTGLIRGYGVREIASGVTILSNRRQPLAGVRSRVAGDTLDMATLAYELNDNPRRGNVMFAMGAVAGLTVLDVIAERQLSGWESGSRRTRHDSESNWEIAEREAAE